MRISRKPSYNRHETHLRQGATRVTLVNVFLGILLTFTSALFCGSWTIPVAAAEPTSTGVQAWLHSASPNTLSTGDDLHVSVTVKNTSSSNLSGTRATLTLGSRALDSLSAQQQWADSQEVLTSDKNATADVPDLAPGASADVSLTLPSSDIDVSYSMTTLPISVQIKGNAGGAAVNTQIHTTTPWTASGQSFAKLSTQLVVPIGLPADPALFSSIGSTRFKAWNKAIGPGSAIDKLLSANPSVPVTWLIDPTVLAPPTAQDSSLPSTATLADNGTNNPASGASPTAPSSKGASSSSSTSTDSSSPSSGNGSDGASASPSTNQAPQQLTTVDELAERLREKLHKRPSSQQVWFTPYGDPDLSALTSTNRSKNADELIHRTLARQLPSSLTAISRTVVAAPVAPLDRSSAARLSDAWHDARGTYPTIITPNATLSGSATSSVTSSVRQTDSGLSLLGVDPSLSEPLESDDMSDAEAAAAFRSRSLAVYQQQPSTSRSILAMGPRATMTPSRLRAIASSLTSLPWLQPTAPSATASSTGTPVSLQTTGPADAGIWPRVASRALTDGEIDTMSSTMSDLKRYSGIVDDGDDIVPAWSRSVDQAAGTRWRGHASAVRTMVQSTHSTVNSIPGRVSVLPSGTINFFTDSGQITVTVRNDLARSVSGVALHLTPRSYAVRFTRQPDPVSIDAGSRAGLRIPTVAQAAGSVDVLASLKAHNGVALGGGSTAPVKFTINARPTGTWIYWALGIVALLIFCYGLARNRKRGTRRRDELARDIQI